MEFNKYSIYTLNSGKPMTDAEKRIHEIDMIQDYNSISKYLQDMFYGDEREELVMFYPDENKKIITRRLENAIEVFAFEGNKQIKAKGWRKPNR